MKEIQQSDNSLVLNPQKKKEEALKCAEFTLSEDESFEENFRYLVAYYIAGYDVIKVLCPQENFVAEERKRIKEEVRKRLIGMEVIGESAKDMVLKSFLKYEDFTLHDAIQSTSRILLSMQEDAMYALEHNDQNRAMDVMGRDNEVNRFYLLVVRQLGAVINDPELGKKIGLPGPRDSLGYRIIVKNMERIGDLIADIAKNSLMIDSPIETTNIEEVGTSARNLFTKTIASLSESDIRKANEVIRDVFMLITKIEGINEGILVGDYSATEKISLLSILKSWNKIAKYCKGIAMVTINMGIKGTVESEF